MRAASICANVLLLLFLLLPKSAAMADGPGGRQVLEQVEYTAYIWAVGAWNFESCRILTDDIENIPQYADIAALCGINTTSLINSNSAWLYYVGEYKYLEDELVDLPEIKVTTDYSGQAVIINASDPLPGHSITRVQAEINGIPAVCDENTGGTPGPGGSLRCSFPIYNLPVFLTAVVLSDYGDQSDNIELRIGNGLNLDSIFMDPKIKALIIGDNAYAKYSIFHDIPRRWGVLPSGYIPSWLQHVDTVKGLETGHYYYYLSGQILLEGLRTAPDCWNNGIAGQYATNCGVLAVYDLAEEYQNAVNLDIISAAAAYGVPSRLIKRVIAVESQFYPGALGTAGELGLYQLTRDGADTLLRWNGAAYLDLCWIYFDTCADLPYDNMAAWQQDILLNHILRDPNNINYLAAALKANAYQVDRLIENVAGSAGSFDYIDLWRAAVINYHTGATVTAAVLQQIQQRGEDLTWYNYNAALERVQPSGVRYINMITTGSKY